MQWSNATRPRGDCVIYGGARRLQAPTLSRRQVIAAGAAALLHPREVFAMTDHLETAYVNCTVWTGIPKAPGADAVGINGDRIALVGDEPVRAAATRRTRIVDLGGAFLQPGFIDNHTHFLRASLMLSLVDLRNAGTPAEFTRRVGVAARALRPGAWLLGGNWDAELWGGESPTRHWIDAVTPDTPVAITRLDLHSMLLNSLALRLAGIDRHTPDPKGGEILRDEHGDPTGIVKDAAKPLVQRVIPPPGEREIDAAIRNGIAHGLQYGVTQVHTPELDWATHDAVRRLRRRGETDMRFYSMVPIQDWQRLVTLIREEGHGDDWVRWGAVKGLVDGSLGSRTALFHKPYSDSPETRGILVSDLRELAGFISDADRSGLQVSIHAIGDAANELLLDMFAEISEANGPRDRRFRVEHAQHLTPETVARFAAQGVIASVQPYHAIDDGRWAVNRIGPERLRGTYAFKSLLDAGTCLSFGSDWPVAPLDPRTGIHAAVLRQTIDGANPDGWQPQERVSVEAALRAYTCNNAYAGFQDDRLGRIAPGYLADFAVLAADPRAIDPADILRVPVLRTVVGGRERFISSEA